MIKIIFDLNIAKSFINCSVIVLSDIIFFKHLLNKFSFLFLISSISISAFLFSSIIFSISSLFFPSFFNFFSSSSIKKSLINLIKYLLFLLSLIIGVCPPAESIKAQFNWSIIKYLTEIPSVFSLNPIGKSILHILPNKYDFPLLLSPITLIGINFVFIFCSYFSLE